MSDRKKIAADLLFITGVVGAVLFNGAYFLRSLHDVTGSSAIQFSLVTAYLLFHLGLGIGAHRAAPSRGTRQLLTTYALWIVLMSANIGAVVTNPAYRWNDRETAQLLTALVLTLVVLALVAVQRRKVSDPMTKASLAIAYKSVPQVLLAWKFLAEGASGTPVISVVVGHITILIRLGQIYLTVREAGWDRNRFWLTVSESANELSWIIATIAWISVA